MTSRPIVKLGLFAGQGDLPVEIIQYCQQNSIDLYVIAFENQTPLETVKGIPHTYVGLGAIGRILEILKGQQIKDIVFAGGIRRPAFSELSLDWIGTLWLTKIGMTTLGDDGLLTALTRNFEAEGFRVHSPADFLTDFLAKPGCATLNQPTADDIVDINRAFVILKQLGDLDIGQALVIQQGLILGIEAIEGTSLLIERVKAYKRLGRGPILIKGSKPNQSLKVDLPTIGPQTVEQAYSSGFAGIAVESNRTQLLNQKETLRLADQYNMFILGVQGFT